MNVYKCCWFFCGAIYKLHLLKERIKLKKEKKRIKKMERSNVEKSGKNDWERYGE